MILLRKAYHTSKLVCMTLKYGIVDSILTQRTPLIDIWKEFMVFFLEDWWWRSTITLHLRSLLQIMLHATKGLWIRSVVNPFINHDSNKQRRMITSNKIVGASDGLWTSTHPTLLIWSSDLQVEKWLWGYHHFFFFHSDHITSLLKSLVLPFLKARECERYITLCQP